jgi:16S rRNA (cytosine1402-N4)-methyltransferase
MEKSFGSEKASDLKNDHKPVLIDIIIEILKLSNNDKNDNKEKKFLDLTFGSGGYSRKILEEFENSKIWCFDQDPITKKYFDLLLDEFPSRANFFLKNFSLAHLELLKNDINHGFFDGILFDLGVSSMQLDDKSRGFSFSGAENELDMRMNQENEEALSAYDFVNFGSEKEIADVIYHYGDEQNARKIAKKIVWTRENRGKIKTTKELADLVTKIVPFKKIQNGSSSMTIHPATKTFQAIRIHVNKEPDHLVESLQNIVKFLKPNRKLFVVTFHSIEDRIVKKFFSYMEKGLESEPDDKIHFPFINQNEKEFFDNFKFFQEKKIIKPDELEISQNIRSRSAKMRILNRI